MKIDFIISSLAGGGAERVLALIVNRLAETKSFEISVITFNEEQKEDYALDPRVKRIKLSPPEFVSNHTIKNIFGLIKYYKTSAHRPDIIISYMTLTNLITIIVARLFSIKIIAQEHISHLRHMEGRKRITDFTRNFVYKKADRVTVLTSFDIEFYEKHGVKVQVMPNPCSYSAITENSHYRKKTILAVGHLDRYHHKGLDNLIELAAPILKEYPDWSLKIAGSGSQGLKHLTQLAEKHHVLGQVIFTGFINNVSEVMYESSIFILPSRFEGLPMVLLEAMSQGMACISYDCKTGPSDIIQNNINGLLIEDQNMHQMQNGLRALLGNENLRISLSNEGIKSLDKYDLSTITERYEVLFNEIVHTK